MRVCLVLMSAAALLLSSGCGETRRRGGGAVGGGAAAGEGEGEGPGEGEGEAPRTGEGEGEGAGEGEGEGEGPGEGEGEGPRAGEGEGEGEGEGPGEGEGEGPVDPACARFCVSYDRACDAGAFGSCDRECPQLGLSEDVLFCYENKFQRGRCEVDALQECIADLFRCERQDDCAANEECVNSLCQPIAGCRDNAGCQGELICVDGECVERQVGDVQTCADLCDLYNDLCGNLEIATLCPIMCPIIEIGGGGGGGLQCAAGLAERGNCDQQAFIDCIGLPGM